MRRSRLVLIGLLLAAACGDGKSSRTVFVEVSSLPSDLLMSVAVGVTDPVVFEARTPIARNVRARAFCNAGVGPSPDGARCPLLPG